MKLSDARRLILTTLTELAGGDMAWRPITIGEECGKSHHRASSWAAPKLKALAGLGLVERIEDYGDIYYAITPADRRALEENE